MDTYTTAIRQGETRHRAVFLGASGGPAQRRSASWGGLRGQSPAATDQCSWQGICHGAREDSATELTATEPRGEHVGCAVSSLRTASGVLRARSSSDPEASPPIQLHDEMPSWKTSTSKVCMKDRGVMDHFDGRTAGKRMLRTVLSRRSSICMVPLPPDRAHQRFVPGLRTIRDCWHQRPTCPTEHKVRPRTPKRHSKIILYDYERRPLLHEEAGQANWAVYRSIASLPKSCTCSAPIKSQRTVAVTLLDRILTPE